MSILDIVQANFWNLGGILVAVRANFWNLGDICALKPYNTSVISRFFLYLPIYLENDNFYK